MKIDNWVRDPIYGYIGLTNKEVKIINTPIFQRLRRIKQLGNGQLVYPSACHTRFEHSLGVLHIAGQMADKLKLPKDDKEIIRYAALLHDIGHGPFSHNFETIIKKINGSSSGANDLDHEGIGRAIIEKNEDIEKILGARKKQAVIDLLKSPYRDVHKQIIDGMIDADKLDYLRRDAYHTGVAYGQFDLTRIMNTIDKMKFEDVTLLVLRNKGLDAFENYRMARYLMYMQVYYHHVKIISERMFEKAMDFAIKEDALNENLPNLNIRDDEFVENYLSLDDYSIYPTLLNFNKSKNTYKFIKMISDRRLLKRGFESSKYNYQDTITQVGITKIVQEDLTSIEDELASKCKCNKDYVIAHLQKINNPLYKSPYELVGKENQPLIILYKNGDYRYEFDVSPFKLDKDPIFKFYIFCYRKYSNEIGKCANELFVKKARYRELLRS